MRPSLLPAAALAGAVLRGCADRRTVTERADVYGHSFRTEQNAEGSGALVVRFQGIMGFLFVSEDSALTALTGLTLDRLSVLCSGGANLLNGKFLNYPLGLTNALAGPEVRTPCRIVASYLGARLADDRRGQLRDLHRKGVGPPLHRQYHEELRLNGRRRSGACPVITAGVGDA